MMTKKEFAVLVVFYVFYMLIGAAIFYHIESRAEVVRREEEREERREIEGKKLIPILLAHFFDISTAKCMKTFGTTM